MNVEQNIDYNRMLKNRYYAKKRLYEEMFSGQEGPIKSFNKATVNACKSVVNYMKDRPTGS